MTASSYAPKFANNTVSGDGNFDYSSMLKELKERFARHIHLLGWKNSKGSKRYEFEVDFMYAVQELEMGPPYLRGKLFERPNNVINRLVAHIKANDLAPAKERGDRQAVAA